MLETRTDELLCFLIYCFCFGSPAFVLPFSKTVKVHF